MLIVIEGIDGAGTTTQASRLVDSLVAEGREAHLTREPSDGPVGTLLRSILGGAHKPVDQTTLSLLFAADRADHIQREVTPAIERGAIVVSDRWYHSSLAYQGTEEERDWIWELNRAARRPDLTIFLRVDPEVAARRREDRGGAEEIFDHIATQRRVAAGYEAAIAMLGGSERIEAVDGHRTLDEIAADIAGLVRETCQAAAAEPTS
jgi:dTMP kinase